MGHFIKRLDFMLYSKFFRIFPIVSYFFFSLFFVGCDPEGRKKCQWVVEPELRMIDKVEVGFVPLCARNRTTMKQDCRLQAKKHEIKSWLGRKFRYVDLKVESPALPRTVVSIDFCKG